MDCVTAKGVAFFGLHLLQTILVWPAAAVVLGLVYRRQIQAIFGRLKTGKWGNAALEFETPVQSAPADLEPVANASDNSKQDGSVANMRIADVKIGGVELPSAFEFERMYNSIFGSQWAFLVELKSAPDGWPYERVKGFFDEKLADVKQADFARWLNWLTQAKLIESYNAPGQQRIRISDHGERFLAYISSMYPALPPRPY